MKLPYTADLPPLASRRVGDVGTGLNPVSTLADGSNPDNKLQSRKHQSCRTGTALLFLLNEDGQAVMLADSKISRPDEAEEEEYKLKRLTATSIFWVSVAGDVPSGDTMLHEIILDLSKRDDHSLRLFESVLRTRVTNWRTQHYTPVKAFCYIVVERTGEDEEVCACLINVSAGLQITIQRGNVLCAGIGGPLAVAELRRYLNAKTCVVYGKARTEVQNTLGIAALEELGPQLMRLTFDSVDALVNYEATNSSLIQDEDIQLNVGGVDLMNLGLLAMRAPINIMEDDCDDPILLKSFHIKIARRTKMHIAAEFETGYGDWKGMEVRINLPYRSWRYQLTDNEKTETAERLGRIRFDEDEVEEDGVELESIATAGSEEETEEEHSGQYEDEEQTKLEYGSGDQENEDMDVGYEAENESEGSEREKEDEEDREDPEGSYEPAEQMETDQQYSSESEGRDEEDDVKEGDEMIYSSEEDENMETARNIAGEQPTPVLLINLLNSLLDRHNAIATGNTDGVYLQFLNKRLEDLRGNYNMYMLNNNEHEQPERGREHRDGRNRRDRRRRRGGRGRRRGGRRGRRGRVE